MSDPVESMTVEPAIQLRRIAKLYGRTAALKALSLDLCRHEVLALLGPNGSGKTTLLKILAGVVTPSLGEGTIFGKDIRRDRVNLRTDVGFLASDTYLYEDLTAGENLRFLATMTGKRLTDAALVAVLDDMGLIRQRDIRVRTFSSGMKRRLSLARVVLLEPRLLLLDEPYNSLDVDAAYLVDSVVRRTAEAGGVVVLATHDADRAMTLCTHVVTLERGALTYSGHVEGYRSRAVPRVG